VNTTPPPGRNRNQHHDAQHLVDRCGRVDDTVLVDCGGEATEALQAEDLERLAVSAYLVGRDDESARAWEQAHGRWVRAGDPDRAARCAFWLAFGLLLRGEAAQANGWLARAARLIDDAETAGPGAGRDCAARGYLHVVACLQAMDAGDPKTADAVAHQIVDLATRFDDTDLMGLGLLCLGEAALALGEGTRAARMLDEAMVAVTTGEISPIPAGIVYCGVIEACMDAFDVRRAAEWTEALDRWCAAQPDLVPFRGQCLVHRSQLLQAHGAWAEASSEADRARQRLSEPAHPALGLALYQQGELHRLRGEVAEAERAYRAASGQGRDPAPGLALLRLAEGRVDAAAVAIRRTLEHSRGQLTHPAMLAAAVDIMLAAGEVEEARSAADELAEFAEAADVPLARAVGAYATGSVLLAEGDATAALGALRQAYLGWRELEMPHDAARARVRIGVACQALGDHDAADLEMDAARAVFERLGARPDLEELARLAAATVERPARPGGLTERECEVLRQVAAGKTDRQIATALVISEHTVGRHLQNIFRKLGLSSRAAATAYAYDHGLV
jgi:DNA-binding CsgD family transcriptional regulator